MNVETQQQLEHPSREPVAKPHDMSLNGDLTSRDDVTRQHHLSAKSPVSDDSGVGFDEHRTYNGSLPITPEGEETRWEAEQEATNGVWRDVKVEGGEAYASGAAAAGLPDNVVEQVVMLEVARPAAGSRAEQDADGDATTLEQPQIDEFMTTPGQVDLSETLPRSEKAKELPVVDKDKDRVDFVPGVHCDNVKDALSILKNKYRLPKPAPKRNVITFSCWNLKDITNTPTHEGAGRVHQPFLTVEDDRHLIDILGNILTKEKEIDRLLEQVLEKERRIHAEESRMSEQMNSVMTMGSATDADSDWPVVDESLRATDVATAPLVESAPPPSQSEGDTKKKRGRLARLLHALRRRLGRRR